MLNMHVEHTGRQTKPMPLKPLPLWLALLFFGIPSLLFRVSLYTGIPFLLGTGMSQFGAKLICTFIPLSLLLIAALVGYSLEGNVFSWQVFKERFRLHSFPGKAWLWIVGGIVVSIAGIGVLAFTTERLASLPALAPPSWYPDTQIWTNWWIRVPIIVISLLQITFNVISEELWWRGYILPRQELNYGTRAWAMNGVLWAFFHAPILPWLSIAQLPLYLTVPFVAQRMKSTWTSMIIHFVLLAIPLALDLLGVQL
jgi:membrane protease YdiL (CAAX protease family)